MTSNPLLPNYSVFRRAILITVIALIMFITGFSVWKSIVEYRLTIRAAELQSRGYARALKEHAERAFSEADNVLLDTLDHISNKGGITKVSSQHLQAFLISHPRKAPQIDAIILVNRDGLLQAHSLDSPFRQINVADREYFIHHRDYPGDDTPFLSRPFKNRINGKWRFLLSRPIRSAGGAFEGLVAVGFESDYFQDFYASLDLGKKGRIVIFRKDGALLLSQPFKETDFSVDFSKSYLFSKYLPKAPKGTFHIESGKALLEPKGRIISYDSLDNFPVIVTANMGTDEVTASWRDSVIKQTVVTLAACLALVFLTILLLRQIKRIERAYRRLTEQQDEIVKAKERYRLLVDNLPVVTWQSDKRGLNKFISRNIEKIYGYTPDEINTAGKDLWLGRMHENDRERVKSAFKSLFNGNGSYDVEYRIQRKDGQWIWIHDFAYATLLTDGKKIAHGVFSDVTDRKQAEEERDQLELQLRQAQKMEAIGHLAGGIAHDFNNLLTPIMGYAEMAAASIEDHDPLAPKLAGIISAAHKAKDLTQQLLSFGRRQSISTEVIDLNEVILSFNAILRRTIRESIRIDLLLDPEGAYIKADKSQMEQIILNLTVNAQDAFDNDQGRITIETCKVKMDGENARIHPGMVPGEYMLLSFQDTGCGMSADVMNHIFEPFFTTKQAGHGTGLGLATVYGIVKQHDAHITVTSREGGGTTFRIYFPCCALLSLVKPEVAIVARSRNAGQATILVVEDNEMVREMVREMLAGIGYTIITAADPQDAIELLGENSTRIDLLVSDVVMPGMSGPELYEQLVVQIPHLKVVYISGYPINPSMRGGELEDEVNYLQKPFTAEALLERIRQVL